MHQGIKTFRMTKVSFAASPISLKMSRRELGHQLSRQARYTHGTALRMPPTYKKRGQAALGSSCFINRVALGWGAKFFI